MKKLSALSKLSADEVLRPEVAVPAVYLLFVISAFFSFRISSISQFLLRPRGFFPAEPSLLTYLLSFLAILVLIFSISLGRRVEIKNKEPVLYALFFTTSLALYLTFNTVVAVLVAAGYALLLRHISTRLSDTGYLVRISLFLALLMSFIIILSGSPLLDASVRERAAVTPFRALFHGFAVFSAAILAVFYEKRNAAIGVLFLAALGILSGFKSDAIAVLLSAVVAGALAGRISKREAAASLLAVFLILTLAGTYIAVLSYGGWKINPFLYPLYRAGLTFSVFDGIVELGFPFGYLHGDALLSTTQEIVSTAVLGYSKPHIITSTLVGAPTLDFGIFGLAAACVFIGVYLGVMHGLKKSEIQICLYAIALVHSFILVEVGIQLSSVLFYLSLLYLALAPARALVFAKQERGALRSKTVSLTHYLRYAPATLCTSYAIAEQERIVLRPANAIAPVIEVHKC